MSFSFVLHVINARYVPRSPNHTVHDFRQNILAVLGSPSCHLYHFIFSLYFSQLVLYARFQPVSCTGVSYNNDW